MTSSIVLRAAPGCAAPAGMMLASCAFLIYSAYVVPMQLSFWMRDDPCDPFPTLYSDAVVDTYFLVRAGILNRHPCDFRSLSD